MGKTWEKSRIISRTYRGDTLYLSKTENSCYITLATDRSLGHEYYSTFKGSDLKTWKQLSGKVLNEKRDIIFLSDETTTSAPERMNREIRLYTIQRMMEIRIPH